MYRGSGTVDTRLVS